MGNFLTAVTPVSCVPADIVPPEDATNLVVESYADRLVFSWNHSANTHGDLAV